MRIFRFLIVVTLLSVFGIGTAIAGGDAAAGEGKSGTCAGCHGADGMGAGDNPKIVGLEEDYFVQQLVAYKTGQREHSMMQMFAGQLSDEDMADLAAYYAGLGGN